MTTIIEWERIAYSTKTKAQLKSVLSALDKIDKNFNKAFKEFELSLFRSIIKNALLMKERDADDKRRKAKAKAKKRV